MGRIVFVSFFMVLVTASVAFAAAGPKVSANGNKHNLRSSNTVFYKAAVNPADRRNDEICIFCHTPHNASPATALWGRKPTVTSSFGYYTSNTLAIFKDPASKSASGYDGVNGGEPNYASRLCLSCHDGATALGAVLNGPEIVFDVGKEKIAPDGGFNIFNPDSAITTKDATQHHHPISFKYDATVRNAIYNYDNTKLCKLPDQLNFQDASTGPVTSTTNPVKLDRYGYMQCTTCHNPHQDMSNDSVNTPFWVTSVVESGTLHDTVCKTCHSWTNNPQ